ncbi:hypothetical protein ECZU31_48640 [Escherichia coli]|nr:hypothetical protein ECZU31_48640 [Escherichia coli]
MDIQPFNASIVLKSTQQVVVRQYVYHVGVLTFDYLKIKQLTVGHVTVRYLIAPDNDDGFWLDIRIHIPAGREFL